MSYPCDRRRTRATASYPRIRTARAVRGDRTTATRVTAVAHPTRRPHRHRCPKRHRAPAGTPDPVPATPPRRSPHPRGSHRAPNTPKEAP
ncbi:hypothetical protein ABT104_30430 [Streptomyces mobaraensis]|uniref:hypothetical protein n=1 Tax=Streptomyces mobaraensis TaxID=35621 RepID=UPI003333C132